MRALVAASLVLLLGACKADKPAATTQTPPSPPAVTARPETPRPALPPAVAPPGSGAGPGSGALDVKRVAELSPALPNAKRIAALSVQDKFGQARESWCTSTVDPTQAAKDIAAQLSHEGWSDISSRGSSTRASVSAVQDGVHVTVSLGGADKACTGLMTHVIYHGAGATAPALEPGERVH